MDVANEDKTEAKPDGEFQKKHGRTTYHVKVFFNHKTNITAKDKLRQLIQTDLGKSF